MKFKFTNLVHLCIFLILIICFKSVTSQDFSDSDEQNSLPETPGAANYLRNSNSYSFLQAPKKKIRKNIIRRPKLDPHKIYLEAWLSVSSRSFRNYNMYPPIRLSDGTEMEIAINSKYFRKNPLYDKTDKTIVPGKYYFWFRLSGRHLYYSLKKDDINILDNIYITSISYAMALDSFSKNAKCFFVKDSRGIKYVVCAQTLQIRNLWICQIQSNLGQPQDPLCRTIKKKKKSKGKKKKTETSGQEVQPGDDKIIEKTITQPVIIIPQPSRMCNEKWDYSNKGRDWECVCREGKQQSPINLPPTDKAILSAIKPIFEYEEFDPVSKADFKDGLVKAGKPIKIRFINHSIRIYHPNMGKAITLDGAVYVAEEIVFHTPSEHTINGRKFDMEMQIIHKGVTAGDIAKTVILSILFKKKAGVFNKFIDKLNIFNLPNPNEPYRDITQSLFIPYAFLDASDPDIELMNPFSFYTYSGSETQPPCAERTVVYVTSKPINIGSVAIEMFREAIKTPDSINDEGETVSPMFPPENNRAIQPQNGRAIFFYDHLAFCGPSALTLNKRKKPQIGFSDVDSKRRDVRKGHYEKRESSAVEYYYVNGETPSGLPGAYVVSPQEALSGGLNNF
jgi:carbonic anhydrase